MKEDPPDHLCFRNVDLEIRSRANLDALKAGMGDAVVILFSGPEGLGAYVLNLELAHELTGRFRHSRASRDSGWPDKFVNALCRLVERLSPENRRLWDGAWKKSFDIGWDNSTAPGSSSFTLKPATLLRVANLGATLAVTVYHRRKTRKRAGAV